MEYLFHAGPQNAAARGRAADNRQRLRERDARQFARAALIRSSLAAYRSWSRRVVLFFHATAGTCALFNFARLRYATASQKLNSWQSARATPLANASFAS